MRTKGLHTQVYKIDNNRHPGSYCLSGTAEVGIAGKLKLGVICIMGRGKSGKGEL